MVIKRGVDGGRIQRLVRRATRRHVIHLVQALLAVTLLLIPAALRSARPISAGTGSRVYWGALIKGTTYGYHDAPWDTRSIDTFQRHTGKPVSILHWGQPWYWSTKGGYQHFQMREVEQVRRRGAIPMINWNAWDLSASGSPNQPAFRLRSIINGKHDAYIRQWARDAKAWGYPLFVRMNHEMNGDWYPWSERQNGNGAGEYVKAWRHVHDIFRQEGASNVTWVWCVNSIYAGAISLNDVYPGDNYVDWVAVDSYNWGRHPAKKQRWQSFSSMIKPTYTALQRLAPTKPIMIAEVATTEFGGSKSAWINDMFNIQLPTHFPQIKAVVWFNWNIREGAGTMDWPIESSAAAVKAFSTAISSNYYASNEFRNLPRFTKIQPMGSFDAPVSKAPTPSPTP